VRIFIDCTDTYNTGLNTGIQRVVRAFAEHADEALLGSGVHASKVIFEGGRFREISDLTRPSLHQRKQRIRMNLNEAYLDTVRWLAQKAYGLSTLQRFLLAHKNDFGLAYLMTSPITLIRKMLPLKRPTPNLHNNLFDAGDILFLPDGTWMHDNQQAIMDIKKLGVIIAAFIHDIIPLTHRELCHPSITNRFENWLLWILPNTDILIFNSNYSKTSLEAYLAEHPVSCPHHQLRAVVHLGYDIPTKNNASYKNKGLASIFDSPGKTYLCVGTIDPRKNHEILLNAFDLLWQQGASSKLLLIGRRSGLCHNLIDKIIHHPLYGKNLFWLDNANDNDLQMAYSKSTALLFPSFVEGFGLPLVEALSYSLSVICSNIPVFREIAGERAYYFPPDDAHALVLCIRSVEKRTQSASQMPPFSWPTWQEATHNLIKVLIQYKSNITP
jgi:alpha-1,2-rhamnosyltransferase